jgi:hypothetical protein
MRLSKVIKATGQFVDWVGFCFVKNKKKYFFTDFYFLFYNIEILYVF